MPERICVALPDGRWLALDRETFDSALVAGAEFAGQKVSGEKAQSEALLDSLALGEQLNIPPSWLEQKAREGAIPSIEFGRWRRFKRSEVEAAVRARQERS